MDVLRVSGGITHNAKLVYRSNLSRVSGQAALHPRVTGRVWVIQPTEQPSRQNVTPYVRDAPNANKISAQGQFSGSPDGRMYAQ